MRRSTFSRHTASVRDIDASERANISRGEKLVRTFGPSIHRDGSLASVWLPMPWSEIDSLSWRCVEHDKRGGWIVPRYLQWGDYAGSTVERSNYEVFQETFAAEQHRADGKPNWVTLHGGHGSAGIAVTLSFYLSNESVREFLDGLHDYCLADESHHSELEMRLEHEAWTDHACDDLLRELAKHAGNTGWVERPELADAFESDDLAIVWPHVLANHLGHCGTSGVFSEARDRHPPYCEGADSCVWPVDEYAAACSEDDLDMLVNEARAMFAAWSDLGAYACLGCRETSAKGDHGTQERLFNASMHECHYPGCPDEPRPGLASTRPDANDHVVSTVGGAQ